jgi:hypothetical protein
MDDIWMRNDDGLEIFQSFMHSFLTPSTPSKSIIDKNSIQSKMRQIWCGGGEGSVGD